MVKLGQHFLKNKIKLQKIVEALELESGDVVIEIGPGKGALTNKIIERFKDLKIGKFKLITIEKDKQFASDLKEKFKNDKNIEIIEGDVLKELPNLIENKKFKNYKIVGNIPYYITGYLFRILGELENKPSKIVLLIQKEVAERACATPSKMNLLAASVQFWAEPKIISYVSRKDFSPPPKVDSAIIKLIPITFQMLSLMKCNDKNKNKENYYKFIKILFKQPRKTILNNISKIPGFKILKEDLVEKLQKIGINPQDRPQNLGIEQIKKISEILL